MFFVHPLRAVLKAIPTACLVTALFGVLLGAPAANADALCGWHDGPPGCVNLAGPYTGPQALKECQRDLPYYADRYTHLNCVEATLEPSWELEGAPR